MKNKTQRTPSAFDLWLGGHPALTTAGAVIGIVLGSVIATRDEPWGFAGFVLAGLAGVLVVRSFQVRTSLRGPKIPTAS